MIKGTYIFYEDGKEIYRSPNIITKFGKRYFTKLLAGTLNNSSKDIAIGIGLSREVSGVTGNGTSVTYTTTNPHGLISGNKISVTNVSPTAFNLTDVYVDTVPSSTTFTVSNTAVGIYVSGGNIVSDVDSRLGFEIYRAPVVLGSTDIQIVNDATTYSIVYKATIPQDVAGIISEAGLYPSTRTSLNSFDSKFIADFDKYFDWSDQNGYTAELSTIGSKVGDNVLKMYSDNTATNEYTSNITLDISGYSINDSLSVAYYKNDINLEKIKIKMYSSNTDYYYVDITPETGTGHKISEVSFGTMLSGIVGSPDKYNISKIGIVIDPTTSNSTSIGMDAIRINDEDTFDPIFGLLSRSILTYPYLTKTAGRQIDIEYKLDLGF